MKENTPTRLELLGVLLGLPVVGFSIGAFVVKVLTDISPSLAERVSGHVVLGFGLVGLCFGVAVWIECAYKSKHALDDTRPQTSSSNPSHFVERHVPRKDTQKDIVLPLTKGGVAISFAVLVGVAIQWQCQGGSVLPHIKTAALAIPLVLVSFLAVGIQEYVSNRIADTDHEEQWAEQSPAGDRPKAPPEE